MTPIPGIPGIAADWQGRVPKSLFWSNTPSLLFPFAVCAPPGAAAGAASAEFREASFGATLHHFCLLLLSAPPLGLLPVLPLLNSEKLVWEQHSITFAYFCCPRPPLGLLPVLPLLNSEKLVWEQHSFTFAHFCCPRPPLGLLLVLNSDKPVLEQHSFTFAHFCCPALLVLNSEKRAWEQHSITFANFCCPRPLPWGCCWCYRC